MLVCGHVGNLSEIYLEHISRFINTSLEEPLRQRGLCASSSMQTIFTDVVSSTPWGAAVQAVRIPQSDTSQSGDLLIQRGVSLYEDIILCAIRKARLLVVSGTLRLTILLLPVDNNVVPFKLVEHDHALGALDACAWVILAPDRGLSWRKSARGGLDVGDPAVVGDHILVRLAAVVGDPETGTDAPVWGALWHVLGDSIGLYSAERSADPQPLMRGWKDGSKSVLVFSGENDEILESDLAEVALVGDGKGVAGCT